MRKKLLVVDDQANIRMMVQLALRPLFDLIEAADTDTAYELILRDRPDGVVLDVMLPGTLNGFQLCERIKASPDLSHIYVALITARGQVADQELGMSMGADSYFVKPFSPLALAKELSEALLVPKDAAKTGGEQ